MYLYYDSNGNLQEQINDSAIIEGETCNTIYCYFDGVDLSGKRFYLTLKKPDGTFVSTKAGTIVTGQIPYNAKRDLRYFAYYTDYSFVEFSFTADTDFDVAGLYVGNPQISGTDVDFFNPITFIVATNNITANVGITSSQYAFLLSQVQGNVYSSGITGNYALSTGLTITLTTATGATVSTQIALPFSSYLSLNGGTMAGNIVTGSYSISGIYQNNSYYLSRYGLSVTETSGATTTQVDYKAGTINHAVNGNACTITIPHATGTIALQEWVTSTLGSYVTNSSLSSALSSYPTLDDNNSFTGNNSFNGDSTLRGTSSFTGAVSFSSAVSYGILPTYNSSPFVAQSTFESVFNSSIISANDVVSKIGSAYVQNANYATTAGTTQAVGNPINLSVTWTSGVTNAVSSPFTAGASYYGVLYFNQTTQVDTGSVGASLKIAGVTSSTAFASDYTSIAFRVEVSYLRTTGRYIVVLEDVNSGVRSVTYLTSAPTSLIALTNDGSAFTASGIPNATIRGTLQIIS